MQATPSAVGASSCTYTHSSKCCPCRAPPLQTCSCIRRRKILAPLVGLLLFRSPAASCHPARQCMHQPMLASHTLLAATATTLLIDTVPAPPSAFPSTHGMTPPSAPHPQGLLHGRPLPAVSLRRRAHRPRAVQALLRGAVPVRLGGHAGTQLRRRVQGRRPGVAAAGSGCSQVPCTK